MVQYISAIAHINLTVPTSQSSLDLSREFYEGTLGLVWTKVPAGREKILAWYNIPGSGVDPEHPQQIHIAFEPTPLSLAHPSSSRHPCFKIPSIAALEELKNRIWEHKKRGGGSAPMEADEPGMEGSGMKGKEFMPRFFARDFAGNKLEFSL